MVWLMIVVSTGIYGIVWPFAMGNCNLDRPTGQYLVAAGKWDKMEVEGQKPEDAHLLLPRVKGRLVKAT